MINSRRKKSLGEHDDILWVILYNRSLKALRWCHN